MRLERKLQDQFVDHGFGFPVILIGVPMVKVRGAWTPDLDYNALSRLLLETLAHKPARLTGNEVRFIRHSFSMTLEKFAERFGVTHPAVIKWEKAGNHPTAMTWAVEKDIRLEVIREAGAKQSQFLKTYAALERPADAKPGKIRLVVKSA